MCVVLLVVGSSFSSAAAASASSTAATTAVILLGLLAETSKPQQILDRNKMNPCKFNPRCMCSNNGKLEVYIYLNPSTPKCVATTITNNGNRCTKGPLRTFLVLFLFCYFDFTGIPDFIHYCQCLLDHPYLIDQSLFSTQFLTTLLLQSFVQCLH